MATLIRPAKSQLMIVDAQQRLVPALHEPATVVSRLRLLCSAASELAVPVTVSEQYPQGLGATIPAIADHLPADTAILTKVHFNCLADEALHERLGALRLQGRPQLVVCGAETHVCVLQTAITAQEAGFSVHVVADACGSRRPSDREIGLSRMARAGVDIVTTEMVVFEWLERSFSPHFKTLSQQMKSGLD
jgi:nicotinamidase-related amidase